MLALSFLVISLIYATVGFGGGSSYLAMLALFEVPYELMPKLGLICNLVVVTGSFWHFWRNGLINKKLSFPFILTSVPLAFLGGMHKVGERTFMVLLTSCLILAGIRLLFVSKEVEGEVQQPPFATSLIVGASVGFLSGMVALGGGIFLSPLMMYMRWGKAKEIAATASLFIFFNSIAGLIGQFTKGIPEGLGDYWPLFIAVFIGGQIGSRIGTHSKVSHAMVQRGTAVLILFISTRLFYKLIVE